MTYDAKSVDELEINDYTAKLKYQRLYLLLLSYKRHHRQKFINVFYGTDFTASDYLQIPGIYFEFCPMKDGKILSKNQIVSVESERLRSGFVLKERQLPDPLDNPNEEIYQHKFLIEVTCGIKRYGNSLDFQKANIKFLNRVDILTKVKVDNDIHLKKFLKNLIQNCPGSWKDQLFDKYGLNEITEEIGIINSQNIDSLYTQAQTQDRDYSRPLNARLLNEMPKESNDVSNYSEAAKKLTRMILKKEQTSSFESSSNNKAAETPEESDKINNIDSLGYNLSEIISDLPSSPQSNDNPEFIELMALGFFPNNFDPLLVKDIFTGKYKIIDTFEIYLKVKDDQNSKIYTLNFKSSDDIFRFIYRYSLSQLPKFQPKYEERIKNRIISRCNKVIRLPTELFNEWHSSEEWIAPSFKETAPDHIFYLC